MSGSPARPTLGDLFVEYEPKIRTIFDGIVTDAGFKENESPQLEFAETPTTMLFRCVPSKKRVLADWRGIASLWAMSQATGRLGPAMFKARRNGDVQLELKEDSEEELGHFFIRYAKELSVPQDWRWNYYFPEPAINSEKTRTGVSFFFRSLEWILRHEIGHIVLGHPDIALNPVQSRAEEKDADLHATKAIKGGFAVDAGRELGKKPSSNELELERRALATGIGLIWVAIYEDTRVENSEIYPPIAERMFRCLDELGLADDSAALEILSDFVKAWIDPEGQWPVRSRTEATAKTSMDEACSRLDKYARQKKL